MPVGILHLQKWAKCLDASVGEEYVEAAEAVLYLRRDIPQRGQVSLIGYEGDPAPAGRLDEFSCVIQLFARGWSDPRGGSDCTADFDSRDSRAILPKRARDRAPYATSRTGNDGNLAL